VWVLTVDAIPQVVLARAVKFYPNCRLSRALQRNHGDQEEGFAESDHSG